MRNKIREKLPIYNAIVNDDDETGVKLISLVDKPAIEIKGYAFAKKRYDLQPADYDSHWYTHPHCNCTFADGVWTEKPSDDGKYPCDLCKETKIKYETWYKNRGKSAMPGSSKFSEEEQGIMEFSMNKDSQVIAGPIMIPNMNIYRIDEDGEYYIQFSKDTIKKLTDKFFKNNNNRAINLDHTNQMVQGYIQEHWIIEDSLYDKSKYYGFNLPVGTSFVVMKVENEEFWNNEVKDKGKFGFSIEGVLGKKLMKYAAEKISFDYHGVLNTDKGFKKAEQMIKDGYDVHIVTDASKSKSGRLISEVADKLGIPESKIHYAEGNKPKVLEELGIKTHYDNNQNIIDRIDKNTDTDGKLLTLSEDDIISYIISDFVEPNKGETENEYISRCISAVINDGTAQDEKQGYAICKTKWDNKK